MRAAVKNAYVCEHWVMSLSLVLFNSIQTVLWRVMINMSKCLCLCVYNGSVSSSEPYVGVIGCCSEGKHYLRSVEPVKSSLCVC